MSTKKKLGVSKDVQSQAGVPINAPRKLERRTQEFPNGWEFPVVKLVNVAFDPAKETKNPDGTTTPKPLLAFVYQTADKKQFTQVEFPIEDDDDKFDSKFESMQQRIKHIWDNTIGEQHFDEKQMSGDDFKEFFDNVAKAFNSHTTVIKSKVEGEPDKTKKNYYEPNNYLKLTYYKDRLQVPQYPNFIQRVIPGKECILVINPTYDKVEPQAKASKNTEQYTGGTNHSFGGDDSSFADFPTVE